MAIALTGALVVLALGLLLALAKAARDMYIVRHVRAMLSDCTPAERAHVCLRLAGALNSTAQMRFGPAEPNGRSGHPPGQEVVDQ
ncbi:hypothetical protein [Streptomyces sp. WAC08241]|uniref:hypothetical protein n=1 Tax=Streptomyces sp. WAC08241 TaxID=2487421 RepID=UPI000F76BEC2|nr:hypothetical protein [Streptomyces sp. WAC08241]RSS40945.1 hypothetical protein EF906_15625 [Streptomyces sp. WAC08241]